MAEEIVVGVGEMVVSASRTVKLISYSLGSCIGLSAHDPERRLGGMINIMLPECDDRKICEESPLMFAETGLPLFFKELCDSGAEKSRLIINIAGGASLFNESNRLDIGQKNCDFVISYLEENGYVIKSKSIRGTASRSMELEINSGKVTVTIPGEGEVEL